MTASHIPKHIAFIMDGNRRWAKEKGKPGFEGHRKGYKVARDIVVHCKNIGVEYVTLYTFSTENWKRKKNEVSFLLNLIDGLVRNELQVLIDEKIRFKGIGNRDLIPGNTLKQMQKVEQETKHFTQCTANIAFSYGSRDEIVHAVKNIVKAGLHPEEVTEEIISNNLYTAHCPDPDLLIRTGGEQRLSNFLLWQLSYAEFMFIDDFWPDFTPAKLDELIEDYAERQRRFGK